METLESALHIVFSYIHPLGEIENIPLLKSRGMICAQDIFSSVDVPPFDRSPLDGFAFNSAETAGASQEHPAKFRVLETIYAGDVPQKTIGRGEAAKIMTGAMLPQGSDCVAAKENAAEKDDFVFIPQEYFHHQNYVFRASDVQKGALLVHKGEKIDFVRMGILAGSGVGTIPVFRKARVGLLCSGDELIPPGERAQSGKIFNSNYALLAGRLDALGFLVNPSEDENAPGFRIIPDNPESVAAHIDSAIDYVDFFVTTGGVSVGDKDIFHDVFKLLGAQKLFWRMDFKPGMSVLCGIHKGKMLMCLSGNPFSAFTVFELLARPALELISGHLAWTRLRKRAVLKNSFEKAGGTRRFVRAVLEQDGVALPGGHTNAELYSLLDCNCFIDIPASCEPPQKGSEVEVVLL